MRIHGPGVALFGVLSLAFAAAACGSGAGGGTSKYPARPEGCDVAVFHENPPMPTDAIGSVSAYCGEDVKDDDCLRTLKDETCKLGGDVVWGVGEKPSVSLGKKKYAGRAAHTTAAVTGGSGDGGAKK